MTQPLPNDPLRRFPLEIDFDEGTTWRCTACGRESTIRDVDDDEDPDEWITEGLPHFYAPMQGVALCEACAPNDPEGPW